MPLFKINYEDHSALNGFPPSKAPVKNGDYIRGSERIEGPLKETIRKAVELMDENYHGITILFETDGAVEGATNQMLDEAQIREIFARPDFPP
jgi:hypothetical protein